jgi:hypothetical protein
MSIFSCPLRSCDPVYRGLSVLIRYILRNAPILYVKPDDFSGRSPNSGTMRFWDKVVFRSR